MKVDLLVAAAVFLSSSILGWYSYQDIKEINQPNNYSIQGISLGKNHYAVRKNNQCLAWLNTDFILQPEITLTYNGALKFNFKQKEYLSKIKGWIFFNAFDQLVHAELKIDFADVKIEIDTKNTNPIDLSFSMASAQGAVKKSFQIPGPIMIKKDDLGKYFLDLSFIARVFPALEAVIWNHSPSIDNSFEVLSNNLCNQPQDLETSWTISNLNIPLLNIIQ